MQVIMDVLLPVFGIIYVGYLIGKKGFIDQEGAKSLNHYVYYIALPALLFISLAQAPIDMLLNGRFIASNLIGIGISFLMGGIVVHWLGGTMRQTTIGGMAASYGTTGYMGILLMIAAFGSEAALPAAVATLIHNIPVIGIVLLIFGNMRGLKGPQRVFFYIFRAVFLNPITLAVLAGFFFALVILLFPLLSMDLLNY